MIQPRFIPALYVGAGSTISLSAAASVDGLACQWRLNGDAIEGATRPLLTLANCATTATGSYSVFIANGTGSAEADIATLTVVARAFLTRAAVRGFAGLGDETLVAGFYLGGAGSKPILIKVSGCAERGEGAADHGGRVALRNVAATLIAEGDVLSQSLGDGGYTAAFLANGCDESATLTEIVDAAPGELFCSLVNLSGRAWVGGAAPALAIDFVITGVTSQTVLIRGLGPGLASHFGSRALADTRIELFDSKANAMAANSGWGGGASLAAVFRRVGACALAANSKDSALVATLAPGAYSVHLTGSNNSQGIGLLEIHDVPFQ